MTDKQDGTNMIRFMLFHRYYGADYRPPVQTCQEA